MTERQTPAIVLTVRDYGEADLLVNFLTPERGPLTGIAKHAKKSRRRFAHCLEPLSRVVFFLSLRRDLKRLGAAALLSEAAGLLAGPPDALREIFVTLEDALALLEQGSPPDSLLPAFLLHLLSLGGYRPHLHLCGGCGAVPEAPLNFSLPRGGIFCGSCSREAPGPLLTLNPGTWKLLRLAQDLPRHKLLRLRFPPPQRDQSLVIFRAFLRYHLGKDLKSWSFWEKVTRSQG
jgi:DNA repair protein RecO (recombination protein O)